LDRAFVLSTRDTVESSSYRIPTRTDAGRFSESKTGKSADESRSTDWWSASYGQCDVSWRPCTLETRGSLSAGARISTRTSAEVMRDQFGIKPKVNAYSYQTPYPPAYDLVPLPNRYKVPDFTKFSGQDDTSTMKHINRFINQCGEAANRDELRVCLFSSSLLGSAFT